MTASRQLKKLLRKMSDSVRKNMFCKNVSSSAIKTYQLNCVNKRFLAGSIDDISEAQLVTSMAFKMLILEKKLKNVNTHVKPNSLIAVVIQLNNSAWTLGFF